MREGKEKLQNCEGVGRAAIKKDKMDTSWLFGLEGWGTVIRTGGRRGGPSCQSVTVFARFTKRGTLRPRQSSWPLDSTKSVTM